MNKMSAIREFLIREALYGSHLDKKRDYVLYLMEHYSEDHPVPGRLKEDGTPDMRVKVNAEWLQQVESDDVKQKRENNALYKSKVMGIPMEVAQKLSGL